MDFMKRVEVESAENWSDICKEVPALNFKPEWEVKIIPPFGGAVARFQIEKNGKFVCSIYLDWYDKLGIFGEPYYELYPWESDIKRYSLSETDELLADIETLFNPPGLKTFTIPKDKS